MVEKYILKEMQELWREENKFKKWIAVELAVSEVQASHGIIPKVAPEKIKDKLKKIDLEELMKVSHEKDKKVDHDVVAFLLALEEKVGEWARFLHFGLTSYDVVDTANALMLREACQLLRTKLIKLQAVLYEKAKRFKDQPIMGRTHGMYAEPTSLGLKFLGFYCEIVRNRERLKMAEENISYGKISGAVGNYAFLDPKLEEEILTKLGLKPEPVSTQVLPRDRHAYLVSTLALIGSALERFALEIRLLQRTEIGELQEPFLPGQRGSSAMPHKRNPNKCERITGLARLLRGMLIPAYENIALWHERDISNSAVERFIFPDATGILYYMLQLMHTVIMDLEVNKGRIQENLVRFGDFYLSEAVLLALAKRGAGRGEAHRLVKEIALQAIDEKKNFKELLMINPEIKKYLAPKELSSVLTHNYLRNVDKVFRRFKRGNPSRGGKNEL